MSRRLSYQDPYIPFAPRQVRLRAMWDAHRTLYTNHHERRLRRLILRDLEEEFGPTQSVSPSHIEVPAYDGAVRGRDDVDGYDDPAMTLGEIGEELGISGERVRQIIERAFGKILKSPQMRASLRGDLR